MIRLAHGFRLLSFGIGAFFLGYDMAERKQIDWEKVETEYRAGKLSLREIARQCDCTDTAIRKKAKAEGWHRDLSAKIEEEVRNKLVRTEVRKSSAATEKEIIDAVATRSTEIIVSERKDLESLRAQENKLLQELDGEPTKLYLANYQGQVIEKVVALTVSEKATTLLALANVRAKRIELERKVWGIESGDEQPPQTFGDIMSLIKNRSKGVLPSQMGGEPSE